MEQTEQIKDVVNVLWQKRKSLLQWGLGILILSALLSLLLKNYYQATTTFYPASQDLNKPDQLFGNATKEMEFYGTSQDLDRLLTICNSSTLKDQLIREFILYPHYEIDSTDRFAHYKIRKHLTKLMNVTKTKYDAIDLSIEDVDRELAAQMTNRAREIVNTDAHALISSRLKELGNTYLTSIQEKQKLINTLSDSLALLRKKYPIYNIESQTETLSRIATEATNELAGEKARYEALKKSNAPKDTLMYLAAKISGLETQVKTINSQNNQSFSLQNFNEGYPKIFSLMTGVERLQRQVNDDNVKYQQTLNTIAASPNAIITVTEAEIPTYKSRPLRSVLIIGVTILSVLLLSMYYLMRHYWK